MAIDLTINLLHLTKQIKKIMNLFMRDRGRRYGNIPIDHVMGGGGGLHKCQYRDVLLTWIGFSTILIHSWVTNLHIFAKCFGISMGPGCNSPMFAEFEGFWYTDGLQIHKFWLKKWKFRYEVYNSGSYWKIFNSTSLPNSRVRPLPRPICCTNEHVSPCAE